MTTPESITYLGWDRPALLTAAEVLFDRFAVAGDLDVQRVAVVLPGRKACRRMLEILVDRSQQRSCSLTPPRIVTVGSLADLLCPAERPLATNRTIRRLVWLEALDRLDDTHRAHLLPEQVAEWDLARRIALAEEIDAVHGELCGEMLSFSDAAAAAERMSAPADRWRALAEVHRGYIECLDARGLTDPQEARIAAVRNERCRTDFERIILLAVADIPTGLIRRMLAQVAPKVDVLVFAPRTLRRRFDQWGCVRVEQWAEAAIEIDDGQIEVADGPSEQAAAAMKAIADYGGQLRADEITLGMADEQLAPYLEEQLEACGIPSHLAGGIPAPRTAPFKLLTAVANYLERPTFLHLATLVRHADMEAALGRLDGEYVAGSLPANMDEYYTRHLPDLVPSKPAGWIADAGVERLERARSGCVELFGELASDAGRTLGQWAEPILAFLRAVYGYMQVDAAQSPRRSAERLAVETCEQILSTLREYRESDALLPGGRPVSAATAVGILLRDLSRQGIAAPPGPAAVELLGWLELPLDDAPALIVTSVNEGFLPESLNAHAFLPNAFRRALGLLTNDRRYARDACALSAILGDRSRRVTLIAALRSVSAEPLSPSRLLLACNERTIARRVLSLERQAAFSPRIVVAGNVHPGNASGFTVPEPSLPYEKDSLHVTQFAGYLASPYGFYLEHVLGLRGLDDAAREIDALQFGTFAHRVLDDFGSDDDVRDQTDPERIEEFLNDRLHARARQKFGARLPAAVQVQLNQLQQRLRAFAQWQGAHRASGWRITRAEQRFDGEQASLEVDGAPMFLHGRIDRVDVHEQTGRAAIWDYKTGENVRDPDSAHRKGRGKDKRWVDLQLPLYGVLARTVLGADRPVELGYICLPRDLKEVGSRAATWTDDELAGARDVAADVVRSIRAGQFSGIGANPPGDVILRAICGLDMIAPAGQDADQ